MLTSNHILLLKAKPLLPPGVFEANDLYIKQRWKQVQRLSDILEVVGNVYLPLLQERQKWMKARRNFSVNDPSAPQSSWLMGKVNLSIQERCCWFSLKPRQAFWRDLSQSSACYWRRVVKEDLHIHLFVSF